MGRISVTENRVLMAQARESLRGRWGLAIGSFVVFAVIGGLAQEIPKVGAIVSILISGPMSLGWALFALTLARDENASLEMIFEGFRRFGTALAAYLLAAIFIILWSLLFIVPGIIAALAYSQIFYVLSEDKTIGAIEAIRKSKEMMLGNKWKFFCLNCRFIGWAVLCIVTLGIGLLWLFPYISVTAAKFYDGINEAPSMAG